MCDLAVSQDLDKNKEHLFIKIKISKLDHFRIFTYVYMNQVCIIRVKNIDIHRHKYMYKDHFQGITLIQAEQVNHRAEKLDHGRSIKFVNSNIYLTLDQ